MSFSIQSIIEDERGRNYDLHREHVNPQFEKVLRVIGFDRCYARAEGPYLWDLDGNQYLDFLGGWAVQNIGRNHPVVREALTEFLAMKYPSLVAFEAPLLSGVLARELKKRMPNKLDHVFFTNSGTEGVEAAIKFAKCATHRPAVVYARGGFHGLSYGSLSINGEENFRDGFGPFLPDCRMVPFNDLELLEVELKRGDVAAFVVEPIQGKGVKLPAPGYLAEASRLCKRYGSLFVADEIQTGVGRTGTFLAIEQEGDVDPDIVILAKGLSAGYVPVGAMLTRREIWKSVYSTMDRAIVHSSTFHQGSMAMAVALATLHVLDSEQLLVRARRMGELLRTRLEALKPKYEFIHEIRLRGLMIAIEFARPKSLKLRTAWDLVHRMDANLFAQAVVIPLMDNHRILTQVAGHNMAVLKLTPPLVINESDVDWFMDGFEQVMRALHQFPGPAWEVLKKLGKHAITKRQHVTPVGAK